MPRPVLLTAALLAIALSFEVNRAAAEDGMQWQFYEDNDPDNKGAMTARLVYGVPETDNVQVMGVCDARPSTSAQFASVTFGANFGDLANGKETLLRFSGGGFEQTLDGHVVRAEGEGLNGVQLVLKNDDPLWSAFAEKESLDYAVPGYRTATLELADGRENLVKFIEACRTYEKTVLGSEADATSAEPAEGSGDAQKDAFDSAKELGTIAAFEAFLSSYPEGFYADLARAYVDKLKAAEAPAPVPETPAPPAPSPKPKAAAKKVEPAPAPKKAATPKCSSRSILIDGKCILKRNAASYCGPGYRLQGNKCVQGYAKPKPQLRLPTWQLEGLKHGCAPGLAWNAQEGCHEND